MLNIIAEMFSFFHFKTQKVLVYVKDVEYIDKAQQAFGRKMSSSTYYSHRVCPLAFWYCDIMRGDVASQKLKAGLNRGPLIWSLL